MANEENPVGAVFSTLLSDQQAQAARTQREAAQEQDEAERKRKAVLASEQYNQLDIMKTLLSFFFRLFSGEDLDSYMDMEDGGSAAENSRRRADIDAREASDRAGVPDFKESASKQFNPADIKSLSGDLAKMRAEKGEDVQAIMPFEEKGAVNSSRGMRLHPIQGKMKMHQGIDMVQEGGGSPDIVSTMPGKLIGAGWKKGYGVTVEILDIYGVTHRYAHLQKGSIDGLQVGQRVEQGQKIGVMGMTGGATGVHLHYEQLDKDGNRRDPIIQGREWAKGDHFDGHEPTQVAHAQKPPAPVKVAASHLPESVKLAAKKAVLDHKPALHEPKGTYGNGKFEVADIKDGAVATARVAMNGAKNIVNSIGSAIGLG